jgi:hypothetical protein
VTLLGKNVIGNLGQNVISKIKWPTTFFHCRLRQINNVIGMPKKLANQKTENNLPRISSKLESQPSEASNAPNHARDFPIGA